MYVLGKTTTSHGIKGELKIKNLSDYHRFYSGEEVFIDDERLIIKSVRSHKNFLLVSFCGYESINDIFKFFNKLVYSKKKGKSEDGHHYEDIISKKVIDEKDNFIGVVKSIREVPQGHILEVEKDSKIILIPYEDFFIKQITSSSIIVKLIEGIIW